MNPIVSVILSRVVAGALGIGAAAVPTVASGEPTAIPATLEELAVQLIMAVAGIAVFYARKKLQKA